MSFLSCQFVLRLYYATFYFVVFDWNNLQNEQLYTLIPVHISCCARTTKICHFSDPHITPHMEQIHYSWAAKKHLFLVNTHSNVSHNNQLTEARARPPYLKVEIRNERQFQTTSMICEAFEFKALREYHFLDERFELATQGTYFNLKQTFFFLRCVTTTNIFTFNVSCYWSGYRIQARAMLNVAIEC